MTRMSGQDDFSNYTDVLRKIKRLTNGGRSLNAIHFNQNLNQIQTHMMLVLASSIDFRGLDDAVSFKDNHALVSLSTLCIKMKSSKPTVVKTIKELIEMGYVIKVQTFDEKTNSYSENAYYVTDKIFFEYAEILGIDLKSLSHNGNASTEGGKDPLLGVVKNLNNYIPNSSPKKENKISKDILQKTDGDADASPHINQNDISNCSQEQEKTKNVTKPSKSNSKRSKEPIGRKTSKTLFNAVFRRIRQPHEHAKQYIYSPPAGAMNLVFDRIWKLYPDVRLFRHVYDEVSEKRMLGAIDWIPNQIQEIFEHAKIEIESQNK